MAAEEAERLVIIDTDGGQDDAVALFISIAAHKDPSVKFRILGIFCVSGNTSLDNVCDNVWRTLKAANALDIPLYRGSSHALVLPFIRTKSHPPYNGYDGFGDVGLPAEEPKVEEESGIMGMIRLVKEHPGQVSILALGPLSNLAVAVRADPSIAGAVKEIVLMGGNTEAVGNATVCGEFNFRADPEAAYVTLSSFPCPITIVPWEIIKRQDHLEFRTKELMAITSPQMSLLNLVEVNNLKSRGRWSPADALAAAVLVEPKVVVDSRTIHVTVELAGNHTRGQMVMDHDDQLNQPQNARVVDSVDIPLYRRILRWGVGGPSYNNGSE